MNYNQFANILAERKLRLGMSEAAIADRSCVSQSTVHRILSGKHSGASWDDMIAIAEALGMVRTEMKMSFVPIDEMLENEATKLAKIMTSIMQSTNQMEGQGLTNLEEKRLMEETKRNLLSGRKSRLWMEE